MPGRWTDAVQENPELRKLLRIDTTLSTERPPFSPRQGDISIDDGTGIGTDKDVTNYNDNDEDDPESTQENQEETIRSGRWLHQSGRKPKGYWSLRVVIQELYVYIHEYKRLLSVSMSLLRYSIIQYGTTHSRHFCFCCNYPQHTDTNMSMTIERQTGDLPCGCHDQAN